jgi:hypothetical protein
MVAGKMEFNKMFFNHFDIFSFDNFEGGLRPVAPTKTLG